MKSSSGQLQTVSIIDTISSLATNHGDLSRARLEGGRLIRQAVGASTRTNPGGSTRANSEFRTASPGRRTAVNLPLQLQRLPPSPPSGPRSHPPPPPLNPRSPKLSLPVLPPLPSPSSKLGGSFADFSGGLQGRRQGTFLSSTLNTHRKKRRSGQGGQGETPEWIRELFGLARRGDLEMLKGGLADMERTLVRNLSDHLGNNLLHIICRHGHATLLPWLAGRLGPELDSALADENKQGLTPVILAIKFGRQELLEWLVTNTSARDRLQAKDGERCLLHSAAKYGQDGISGWLSDEMTRDSFEIDQLDMSGNTPLHLAARAGNTTTASCLLNMGASVNMKNDMGLKPSDCASIRSKKSTEEFLLMFETSLGITKDWLASEKASEQLNLENGDLKSSFRDVLMVSKKLTKEREEMCREQSRLHETMMEIHDKMIMEMQVKAKENTSLKKDEINNSDESNNIESTIKMCESLHEKWQQHQNQYFNSSLADLEHRIMLAEDSTKKSKQQQIGSGITEPSYAHRNLRDRLEEVRSQSSSLAEGARKLSTTGSSTDKDNSSGDERECAADREDDIETDSNFYEAMKSPLGHKNMHSMISQRKKLATPSPFHRKSRRSPSDQIGNESMYSSLSSPMYSSIGSPGADLDSTIDITDSPCKQGPGLDYTLAKATASELAKSANYGYQQRHGPSRDDRRRSRADLKKRLKQLALTSESGSASVIEVIEPNSSEEEEFKKSLQEMNISWSKSFSTQPQSRNISGSMGHGQIPSPSPSSTPSKASSQDSGSSLGKGPVNNLVECNTPHHNPTSIPPTKKLSEMGISATSMHHVNISALFPPNNNKSDSQSCDRDIPKFMNGSKNLLTSEPDILLGIKGARQDTLDESILELHTNHVEDNNEDEEFLTNDFGEDYFNEDFSDVQMLPYDLESERSESSLQIKKKGFLQKLSISKWAQKKKSSKIVNKGKEIPLEYFRETYSVATKVDDGMVTRPMKVQVENVKLELGDIDSHDCSTIFIGEEYDRNQEEGHRRENSNISLDTGRLTKSLSPSSRKSLYAAFNTSLVKEESVGLSVATSDDSGIIAGATTRPLSSSSKSEASISRPDSSSSEAPSSHSRKIICGSLDHLIGPDNEGERGSRVCSVGSEHKQTDYVQLSRSSGEFTKLRNTREGTTVITLNNVNVNGLPEVNNNTRFGGQVGRFTKSSSSHSGLDEEKPWYDVSDDDIDIQTSEHITSIISVRGSSDDEPF